VLELDPDDRTHLFEELPGRLTQRLLNMLSPSERVEALKLLGYPENSVGRLMTSDYVAIKPDWTISRALEHVREWGKDAEIVQTIYVVDKDWHLIDDILLRTLILTPPEKKVEDIMDRKFVSLSAFQDQEEAIKVIKKYDRVALPVVDSEGVLLGIVTVDDILDIEEEETTEDIQKGAAISPLEISYTSANIGTLYRKRVWWLLLLLIGGFLSSSVIAAFENAIKTVVALAFFIPVLIDTGGNTGTQSATLVIRAIALGDLDFRRWFSVFKKELIVGILLGITLGVAFFLRSYFWNGEMILGVVLGISLVLIVLWANLVGGLLPLLLKRFGLDPAVISSPLITTLVDATGLCIYFFVASWLLNPKG
jgi:magnesium transporter